MYTSIIISFFVLIFVSLNIAQDTNTSSTTASPSRLAAPCKQRCNYYLFEPVCARNGRDTTVFPNRCFLDNYNCDFDPDYIVIDSKECWDRRRPIFPEFGWRRSQRWGWAWTPRRHGHNGHHGHRGRHGYYRG